MSVYQNNRFLKRVNPEIVRAANDSGSSLNHSELQKLMRQMTDLDIADNLKLWVHRDLVKTRTSGSDLYVPKSYDISGEENDAAQATSDNQPKLVSLGMSFDGSNDILVIPDHESLIANTFTHLYYVNLSKLVGCILTKWSVTNNQRGYFEQITVNGYYRCVICHNGVYGFAAKDYQIQTDISGGWVMLAVTYQSPNLIMYINGVSNTPVKTTDFSVTSITSNKEVVLGNSGDYDVILTGSMNDIRIFNKALSATEIAAIYNETKSYYGL